MTTHRTTAILLAVSVALNLFFLGVATSWAWHRRHDSKGRGRTEQARKLGPAEARRAGGNPRPDAWLSDAERAELRPRRKALKGLRLDAETLLRADTFDAEKFKASLAALRTENDAIQASLHELLTQRASAAGLEERRRLADVNWTAPPERRRPARHD